MKVEGISGVGAGAQPWMAQEDAETKGIRNQIQEKQKELQKLSEDENMSPDEKMKRRQKLQQEISDLNAQLRMHQMQQRTKARESAKEMEVLEKNDHDEGRDAFGKAKGGKKGQNTGLSKSNMQAMISADCGIKQAKTQGSVAQRMEDRAEVLKAEIKQDEAYGTSTDRKEEELDVITEKGQQAQAAQMGTLGEANRVMKKAAGKEADRVTKEAAREEPTGKESVEKERGSERGIDTKESGRAESEEGGKTESEKGAHVDVRV